MFFLHSYINLEIPEKEHMIKSLVANIKTALSWWPFGCSKRTILNFIVRRMEGDIKLVTDITLFGSSLKIEAIKYCP